MTKPQFTHAVDERLPENAVSIPGFPSYCITTDGTVYGRLGRWPHRFGPWRPLRHHARKKGRYHTVRLTREGKGRTCLVHQLVALTFLGPPPPGQECRHLNDNKDDNRALNLAYGTRSQNMQDASANGRTRRGEQNHFTKLTAAQVLEIRAAVGVSQSELAGRHGISQAQVCEIRNRTSWSWLD